MMPAPQSELERECRKVASLTGEVLAVYEELGLLYSLGPLIGSLVDNDQIAALAVREAVEILRADCGWAVFNDGTTWRLPVNGCVAIDAGTAARINKEVLGPLRFRGQSPIISHALAEEYGIDDPTVPARFLACPLPAGGGSLGCICLGRRQQAPIFTSSDQKLLYAAASLTGMTLENLRLQRSEMEKERLAGELDLARRIQQSLLPRDLSCGNFLEASGSSVPCYEIGGDYFDLFSLDPKLCLLAIADVSGKGPAAALQATMCQGIVHAVTRHSKKLVDLMRTANQCIRERTADNSFVTAFVATLDSRGRLRYSNAGHNPPLLIQSGGHVTELAEGTVPLGLVDNDSYLETTAQLEPGDLLVLYTDGLTDSENAQGETFGTERVLNWAARQWQLPAVEVEKSLLDAVTKFCNGRRQGDDLTLLVIRFLGAVEPE
jgi:sigma-B regulation protein RsbU (phosphoserine phosphatase)